MPDDSDRRSALELQAGPFEPGSFAALLDRRIVEMRRMVHLMQPGSHADTLRALRDAFPDASLAERVAVLRETAG
jgi:hypothetical protein